MVKFVPDEMEVDLAGMVTTEEELEARAAELQREMEAMINAMNGVVIPAAREDLQRVYAKASTSGAHYNDVVSLYSLLKHSGFITVPADSTPK